MKSTPSVSERAEIDLTNQYRWYLENAGETVAERFFAAFGTTVERLSNFPELGRLRRFRDPQLTGMRSLRVGGPFAAHLIFYRHRDEGVSIERVMHGARDLAKRLLEPPGSYNFP